MKRIFTLVMAAMVAFSASHAAKKIAFVYEPGYNSAKATNFGLKEGGYSVDQDPIYAALDAEFDLTEVQITSSEEVDYEYLQTFDCVVFSEGMAGNTTASNNLVKLVGTVPVVSMKAYNYTSGRWSWATPSNPGTKTSSFTITPGFEDHPIFEGLEPNDDGSIALYDESQTASSNRIQGFAPSAVIAGSTLEGYTDYFMATANGTEYVNIHEIPGDNPYVLVSMSSDNIWAVNANGQKIIVNAVNYVMGDSGIDIEEEITIAYLYDSSYGNYCGIDNDPIFNYTVIAEKNSVAIDVKDFVADDTMLDSLATYDLVVISEAIGGTHKFGITSRPFNLSSAIAADGSNLMELMEENDMAILDECLLEFAGEGKVYPTMIRMAKRWGDGDYKRSVVSDRVCLKYGEKADEMRPKIESQIFVPWDLKLR